MSPFRPTKRSIGLWLCFAALVLIAGCRVPLSGREANPAVAVSIAEDYNRLFTREDGWTGGDIATSIPLRDGRILWLFGDSWIGPVRNGRHTNAGMVHNTVALQQGLDPASARLEFFWGEKEGKPDDFIKPANGTGEFWLTHGGIETERALYLFMSHIIHRPGDTSIWNFQGDGIVMAKITNASEAASRWHVEQIKVPWADIRPQNERGFGMPLLREGKTVYLYGLELDKASEDRYLLAGRANVDSLEDFSTWEFYADGAWQRDFRKASRLCNHLGAELSVSYLPRFRRYVLVYTENGLSDKIMMRFAGSPVGPWSSEKIVYKTPEMAWDSSYFCYAAKGHAELSRQEDELIVSYVCNANDFWKMAADARIYRPEFLRLKFK